ncbi:uncharacterized protein V1518DRAFT_414957 [Limtongia smithiae]|uniref:uncharacterized protein n=1 Tax=Limtongia smithiae TaxID=1125753 RepID=UPI0034D01C84
MSVKGTQSPVHISYNDGEFLVFDLGAVKFLREEHRITGILTGTLSTVPQQNVFLGLPLQLLPEEATLLVQMGIAVLVDNSATHATLLKDNLEDSDIDPGSGIAKLEAAVTAPQTGALFFSTPTLSPSTLAKTYLPDFTLSKIASSAKFQTYKYLHSHGYFVSPGLRFGADFMAYPGDPLRYHSHYLVRSLDWDEEFSLIDLVGSGRLGTGVKKAWMVGGRVPPSSRRQVSDDGEIEVIEGEEFPDFAPYCIEWAGFG